MKHERIQNVQQHVINYAESIVGKPFVWGETDCANIIRNVLKIMYAYDVCKGIKKYKTEYAAKRRVVETGGTVSVLKRLGAYEIQRNFCQTGDFIVSPNSDGFDSSFAVINDHVLSANPEKGVILHALSQVIEGSVYLRMPEVV